MKNPCDVLCEMMWEVTKISHEAICKIQVAEDYVEVNSIAEKAVAELKYILLDSRMSDLISCDWSTIRENVEKSSNEVKEARWNWAVKQFCEKGGEMKC